MHYLKVTAQDRSGNGKADAVLLHFHNGSTQLVHEAFAVDMSANGSIEFGFAGDINGDGEQNLHDQLLLTTFAEVFLQLGWFNAGDNWERCLKIGATDYHGDGSPNVVTLEFSEDEGSPCSSIRIRTAAAYDGDNDGILESFTNSDVNADGIANKADKLLLRKIAEAYLAFHWFGA